MQFAMLLSILMPSVEFDICKSKIFFNVYECQSMINTCLTVGTNPKTRKIAFMMIYGDFISVRPVSTLTLMH